MKSVETAPPTFCVGRVGRAQLGPLLLEGLQPPQADVVVGVRQRRVVEHEVAPAGVLDLLGDLLVLGPRVGRRGLDVLRHRITHSITHGNILPPGTDNPSLTFGGAEYGA